MNRSLSKIDRSRRALLKSSVFLISSAAFGQAQSGARGAGADGTTLVLLGTQGGPNVNLDRSEAASAVLVNGQPYLVDCGYGTLRALVQAGIAFGAVTNIFITHLHDDHTADIPALLSHKWTGSAKPQPATVFGPHGVRAMVEGAIAFFKANTEIRMVDEGRTVRPETVFSGRDLSAPTITEVFRDDRVTVKAVENSHFPERAKEKMPYRSLAYRFNTADRSIVFSGDTAYSTSLIELARDADVFVCEAMDMATRERLQRNVGAGNTESIARHVVETHSSTEDVGRMAAEAKVKTVVLNHLLPGSNGQRGGATTDDSYIASVRKFFSGQVVVGRDQLRL